MSAVDSCGRTILVVDAHRGDGKRFVVRADEKLTADLFYAVRSVVALQFFEIARVLVRLNHVARRILNANHSVM